MPAYRSTRKQPRNYGVLARKRQPLLDFMTGALEASGCRMLHVGDPGEAPFRLTFETPLGERMGVIAYAFLANQKLTRNRPADEHRFQLKYGARDGKLHEIWQDPFGLYTTLLVGINPEQGFFVSADPVLHNPTRMFISVEFKQHHVDAIQREKWTAWERDRRMGDEPIEVLVGGTQENFLRCIRFERDACGLDQGHRQLLAEKYGSAGNRVVPPSTFLGSESGPEELHALAREFDLSPSEVLDLIARTRRLKMAVRGWVAEEHLVRELAQVPGVTECQRLDVEGGPDVTLRFEESDPITVECKNALRKVSAGGTARVDFQRTRASRADPCSRYYSARDFDVVAACLHSVSERWEFRYIRSATLAPHPRCPRKLSNQVRVDTAWRGAAAEVFREVVRHRA